jgi:hypothetical protein
LPDENIDAAQTDLKTFVSQVRNLYRVDEMDFCVHSLLHLGFYAKQFGCLSNYANFAFEGLLKIIKTNLHGTREFQKQFETLLSIIKYVSIKEDELKLPENDPEYDMVHRNLTNYFGAERIGDSFFLKDRIPEQEKEVLKETFSIPEDAEITCFAKFKPSNSPDMQICTAQRGQQFRSDSSWIYTSDGKIGRIVKIARVQKRRPDNSFKRKVYVGYHQVKIYREQDLPFNAVSLEELYLVKEINSDAIEWIPFKNVAVTMIGVNILDQMYLSHNIRYC